MTTITFRSDNAARQRRQGLMFGLLRAAAAINILALVGVCAFLIWNGSPAISWEFLTQAPRRMMTTSRFSSRQVESVSSASDGFTSIGMAYIEASSARRM